MSSSVGSLTEAAEPTSLTCPRLLNEEAYRTTKTVLNMIAVQEAIELGSKCLKVTAIYPGFVVSNLRGTSDEAWRGWGMAGDSQISGETIVSIVLGGQDTDADTFVYKDDVYP